MDVDVTVPDDVRRLIEETMARYGRLDVFVNNAGMGAIGPSESLPLDVWRRTIDVNLTGVFLCAQAAGKVMLDQGHGVIINVAIFGLVGMPQRAAYAASKHGVIGLTRVLGVEWARTPASVLLPSTRVSCGPLSTTSTRRPVATPVPMSSGARQRDDSPRRRRWPGSSCGWQATRRRSSTARASTSTADGLPTAGGSDNGCLVDC